MILSKQFEKGDAMLGLLALGLTSLMIYTLVKNALMGRQLSKEDSFHSGIELIIPLAAKSEFYIEAWLNSVKTFHFGPGQLKVHLLIDGHHPSMTAWQELREKVPYLQIHCFTMRPSHVDSIPWMLDQISSRIEAPVVIIGDPELVPTEHAFTSVARMIQDQQKSFFILPQTARFGLLGEAANLLGPTLSFISLFGQGRWRSRFSHPLLGIAHGWLAMPLAHFKQVEFKLIRISNWKEAISRQWVEKQLKYSIAFGEKHLLRYYSETFQGLIYQIKDEWEDLWNRKDKTGFWLYLTTVFIWAFPMIFLFTHFFWALSSIFLLSLYRFFTKIVFQESWMAMFLHPVGCGLRVWGLLSWLTGHLRSRYGSRAPTST
jgi:hypothetical protein